MAETPRLDTMFTLEAAVRTPDGGGGWSLEWQAVGILWGELRPASARESTVGGRPTSRVTHQILLRRGPTGAERPDPQQRLVHRGRVFAIRGVAGAGPRDAYLTVWAEEGPVS